MKKQAYTIIAAIVLFGCMAVSAQAQCVTGSETSVNIPFQFNVREKTMPAGNYTFTCSSMSREMLLIRNSEHKVTNSGTMIPVAADSTQNTRLVFRRYGDRYFLAQVWNDANGSGLELPKSRAERAIERELGPIKPSQTEVALRKPR